MLIEGPEQILFDFVNRYSESMATLDDDILFASPWGRYPLDEPNGELLMELLQRRQIRVHAQKYALVYDSSADDHRRAQKLAGLFGKRNAGSLLHALRIYQKYEPLKRRNEYNALYYPDLQAYVRFGILHPTKLLDMLNQDDVNGVVLFRDCVDSYTEDRFFIFTLGVPQSEYRAIMENAKEQQFEKLCEAAEMANARCAVIFPDLPSDE